jgi:2-(1,2-epoxy-1,2-dihydrophenyl)acetyl-CoA isomerase
LQIDRRDGIVTVTLDRPERRNALSVAMFQELEDTFRQLGGDFDVRAVVLTGAGGHFCSGLDLAGLETPANWLPWVRKVANTIQALYEIPKPVIAKVAGSAVGAGMNLALACDLVVAADDARFAELFTKRGISIDFGGSWLLPRIVGLQKAKELVFLADTLDAHEALAAGLVNRVVPLPELDDFVADWAARLAAGPPLALGTCKRLLNASFSSSFAEALENEATAQALNLQAADFGEGIKAFQEKRPPRFVGH